MRVNPVMLQMARECRAWTQREVGKAIGVTQAAIAKYELGQMDFPHAELERLGDALDFDPSFFLQYPLRVAPGGDFLYRRRSRVKAKSRKQVAAEANIRMLQVDRLLEYVELDGDHRAFPSISPDEVGGNIDRIAERARDAMRIPDGPISNLTGYVEAAGAIIFAVDFETDHIDGTNIKLPGHPPLLFLNQNVPGCRHRFNIAHELGHVVMHSGALADDSDPEGEANQFARELLMPRKTIRSDLRNLDLRAAERLKSVWGVSMAALIVRAGELGAISEHRQKRLYQQMNAMGIRRVEPGYVAFEEPQAFDAMLEAFQRIVGTDADCARRLMFTDRLGSTRPRPEKPTLRLFSDNGDVLSISAGNGN